MKTIPVSAIILTFNEESKITECLESCEGIFDEIFIVDSYSTDGTLDIASQYNASVLQNEFINYSRQRNWAFQNLPIKNEWIINLDADHRISADLKSELIAVFANDITSDVNGFLISRKTLFMDRWIKYGGHYPSYHSVLFRKGKGFCEDTQYDQHFVVHGKKIKLKTNIIDIVTDSLSSFTERHNRWSSMEISQSKTDIDPHNTIEENLLGNPIERKRYLKNIYYKFPLFIRPFLYFLYRYIIRLGFLDGKEGLIFHFLQGFWFRFLIDAKLYEQKKYKK